MPGEFGTPILVSPADFELVASFTPTLSWTDPGGVDCVPTGYSIMLATNQAFTGSTIGGMESFPSTSWTPGSALSPKTEYWWKVAAITEQPGRILYGEYSSPRRFYTGPVCSPSALASATLQSPTDGATISTPLPLFEWNNGNLDCFPGGYRIDLSTSSDFVDPSLSGGTGNPSTDWLPGEDLSDCTQYFWRVAPIVETTLGPYSETWTFNTDFASSCPQDASLSGMVWHDLCAVPWGPSDPSDVPPGCVTISGGLEANGSLDPGEPGMAGVTLHLGSGACPSTGVATAVTAGDGSYTFSGLAVGTYCVSVDALNDGNDAVLIPGGWTFPVRGDNPQDSTQALSPGENLEGVNFGWDYQFLPAPPSPEPFEEACFYEANRNSNCRMSDYQESKLIAILMQGERAELIGLNPELTHGKFLMENDRKCWIWLGLMEGPENPVETCEVPVTDPPPKPEPEPIQCQPDLPKDECERSGGTWSEGMASASRCVCPQE
jgi:hypothetical protein